MAEYDYVIVGAGSAGCVLANRLTADPSVSVLLIEAGASDRTMNVRIPAAFSKLFKTKRDWDYNTEPEPHLDGRSLYIPRGKMLGGSSSMNAMIYIRGNRADYDGWAERGAKGWGYDDVLPYFRRAENNERGADAYHGTGGPLNVADLGFPNPVTQSFVDGGAEVGIPKNSDFNGPHQEGMGLYQVTQKRGQRWSASKGYLRPILKRPNLTVRTEALARRVVVSHGRATAVEYDRQGETILARARREVILSGGAINSPQLLMLSGIGSADQLRAHGIDVLVDNPNVGAHLQDHPFVLMSWETSAKGTLAEAEKPLSLGRYLLTNTGLLSSNIGEGGGFFRSSDDLDAPDLQFHFAPAFFQEHGFATHTGPALSIGPTLVAPASRGSVTLRSADPAAAARISTNVFDDPADLAALMVGVEKALEITKTSALRELVGTPLRPGPELGASRAELEAWVKKSVELVYHPTCTARMGDEASAVVDPELRVHGIDGLRVVDASVMPTVTRGNTNAPTIMIAEKAADLILGRG
ncbi:MAG TPA: choline dehydrogenase [Frankiaceae bacterium]|nr:choline dehydrogenase [Frankiaceae bacterium]